jgi:hypothetical protein
MPESAPDLTALARSVERVAREVRALAAGQGTADRGLAELAELVAEIHARQAEMDPRLTELYGLVINLADTIAQQSKVVEKLQTGTRNTNEQPEVRSWLQATDADQAQKDLAALAPWIDEVYLKYPDSRLPSCWAWHPHAIEELWVLYLSHRAAFTGLKGSPRDASDWHDRQLPGVQRRLFNLGTCALAEHAPGKRAAAPTPTAALTWRLSSIAAAWVTGTIPTPTDADLAAAKEHEAAAIERL